MGTARLNVALSIVLTCFFGLAVPQASAEPPQPTARESIDEAVRLREAGQLTPAVEKYQQSLQLEPDNTEALYGLAETYVKLRRHQEAIPHLSKSGASFPGRPSSATSTTREPRKPNVMSPR